MEKEKKKKSLRLRRFSEDFSFHHNILAKHDGSMVICIIDTEIEEKVMYRQVRSESDFFQME